MTTPAYPLQWPAGRARTSPWRREDSKFEVTFTRARDNIVAEVQRLQAAEAELARLAVPAAVSSIAQVDVSAMLAEYERRVERLEVALLEDREAARRMLGELLGSVRLRQLDGQVWAELESNEPARLLVAGSPLGLVAGARSGNRKRIRLV